MKTGPGVMVTPRPLMHPAGIQRSCVIPEPCAGWGRSV